jgi:crotonobetainyl-CoA:carnitine CoA-transferase CaiB-like acyl-CoA transferase
MQQPLSGIKVVDLTRILSGPFCTMLLGDMGADVIKIEGPKEGDPVRKAGAIVNDLSWYFASFNRNKRSMALDLRSEHGKEILRKLIQRSDVLVENFRPGVLAEMGFDEASLERINPRLIVASINGYGSTGPYADRPTFDFVVQAMSGFMSTNGGVEHPALRSGPPITDLVAGLYAAFGIVCAVRARELTGRGQRVDAGMMTSMLSMFAYLTSDYLATGQLATRTGNDHPIAAPYGMFSAIDGEIAVAPSTEDVLFRFLSILDLAHLLSDERFKTNELRLIHRKELNSLINERLKTDTQTSWINRLNSGGVPCGRVQNVGEALNDPQMIHQEMVLEVDHPSHGLVKMVGFPLKLSDTPCSVRFPAPKHGEHNREILDELGIQYPADSAPT